MAAAKLSELGPDPFQGRMIVFADPPDLDPQVGQVVSVRDKPASLSGPCGATIADTTMRNARTIGFIVA